MTADAEREVWDALDRHLRSIFGRDPDTYRATTADDLALYEWFVTPHRQDGLPLHLFLIRHGGMLAGAQEYRYDLLEPRLQLLGDVAVVSYTFLLTVVRDGEVAHRTHNESRVLHRTAEGWRVVHVHKSPAWSVPHEMPEG